MKTVTVIIYEDHTELRQTLVEFLNINEEINVIADFGNCVYCYEEVKYFNPDVIIMDIDMPGMNGVEGVKLAKSAKPEVQILMHTVFEDPDKIFKSIENGANGYLLKNNNPDELANAIVTMSKGGGIMSPSIAAKMLSQFRENNLPTNTKQEKINLNERETQILQLLIEGNTYKTIANQIFLSVDTVRYHIKNIYTKLHVNNSAEAVSKALRLNLLG